MNNTEEQPNQFEKLLKLAEEYGVTVLTLWKFKALDKVSDIISSIVVGIGLLLILIMIVFMATIGVSLWIGAMLGRYWYGFFIIAGVYVLFAVVLKVFLQKWFKKVVVNNIIKKFFK